MVLALIISIVNSKSMSNKIIINAIYSWEKSVQPIVSAVYSQKNKLFIANKIYFENIGRWMTDRLNPAKLFFVCHEVWFIVVFKFNTSIMTTQHLQWAESRAISPFFKNNYLIWNGY